MPCGRPNPTRGVHDPSGDCTPPAGASIDREGLPDFSPVVGSGARNSGRDPPRRGARGARQAYGATRLPSSPGELTAEDQESEGNGPSPPGSPVHTRRGPGRSGSPEPSPDTPETLTASEQPDPPEGPESSPLTEFSDFFPGRREDSARPGQFATAQLQDEALTQGSATCGSGAACGSLAPPWWLLEPLQKCMKMNGGDIFF